mgnify:CR=1 FL=1
MKKLNKKGFTLVELLAVIVILALLMVVATRTIGSTMTTSKYKAMQTEAQKIFSKTYEEFSANIMLGDFDLSDTQSYSYGTMTDGTLEGKDGDYSYKLEFENASGVAKLKSICITDTKSGGYSSAESGTDGKITISGTTLTFANAWSTSTKSC